jgi:hypothetical protein
MNFKKKLNNLIPGGCHTYSCGSDQFPFGTPEILISEKMLMYMIKIEINI